MSAALAADPVLRRVRQALDVMYGDRLERAVLFGSRARGDARDDSDYDVAVFIRDMKDRWPEMDRLAVMGVEICDETGEFVHAMAHRAGSYAERTPLMMEIRRDGIDL